MPRLRFKKIPLSLLWIPIVALFSFSIIFAIKWGLKPKPIPQINPTSFEELEQIGAVTYRRLSSALRQEKMLIMGSAPWIQNYEKVWNGFIAAAREDHWKIDIVFEETEARAIKSFSGLERESISMNPLNFFQMNSSLKKHLSFGHLVLVHTWFNYSAHKNPLSLTLELEKQLKRPWPAITMLGFAISEAELLHLQPPCRNEINPPVEDYSACAAMRFSRRQLRRRLDPNKNWAALEQHGLKDYFLYIHQKP
ncbi:MAG: hypothetical protein K1X29_03870 [Bdellovibrionales bacterium]|nr:hypothetical protein [Bdellovibrionales bacterium]